MSAFFNLFPLFTGIFGSGHTFGAGVFLRLSSHSCLRLSYSALCSWDAFMLLSSREFGPCNVSTRSPHCPVVFTGLIVAFCCWSCVLFFDASIALLVTAIYVYLSGKLIYCTLHRLLRSPWSGRSFQSWSTILNARMSHLFRFVSMNPCVVIFLNNWSSV